MSDDKNKNGMSLSEQARIGLFITGSAKSEKLQGTSRNDVLDGGAGSDELDAGSGNDLLIWRMSENAGSRDRYDGGSGTDTLRLEFTRAEWMRADVQADIARFLAFVGPAAARKEDEERGEVKEASSEWFAFRALGLDVRKIELLEVRVDGVSLDARDQAVTAVNDAATVNEDGSVAGNVLANDLVPDLLKSVELVSGTARGTLVFNADGSYAYTPGAVFNSLAQGQTATEQFTYRITDADGDTSIGTVVITIAGTNDGPVVTNAAPARVGAVTEDTTLTATGQLSASDVDNGATQTWSVQGSATGTYGSMAVDATGRWTYTLDNASHQNLASGERHDESFTLRITDDKGAYVDQTVTITVNGTNDGPVITNTTAALAGAVTEDTTLTVSGQLSASDVDNGATQSWSVQGTALGTYGGITVGPAGQWTYTLDNAGHQSLAQGESHVESFTIRVTDDKGAYVDQVVSVTVNGTNDAAIITGTSTASLTESNAALSASGTLSATDVDSSAAFVAQTNVAGSNGYGVFYINAAGTWTYSAGAHNEFVAGQSYTDSLTVATADGTSQVITVTIAGTNDAAIITGTSTASLTETNAALSASGTLSATDVDSSAAFVAQTNVAGSNGYGLFSINATGTWTYSAGAHNEFVQGQSYTDSLTVATADGTQQVITVTIAGTNDAAIITGTSTASLNETNAALSASGTLSATDVDSSAAFVAQTNVAGSSGYGLFSIDAAGAWTYSAGAHNEFVQGQSYTDSITVATADGTTQVVTVTIAGTNDAAIITGTSTASLTETNAVLSASGTLSATDVDSPSAFVAQTTVAGSNGYGVFSINAAGAWTYATNTAHNEFVHGQSYADSIRVATVDGTSQVITVTIVGTNDAAVLSSSTVSLTETNAAADISTSGTLLVSDIDSPASFVAQAGTHGSYGTFALNAAGAWTYTADSAHNEFVAGTTYTDTFAVTSADGTTTAVNIHILGTEDNHAPVAPDVTLRVNQLGNGGFDATPDFSGWHVTTTLSGMTSGTTSAIINRSGTLIPGDNAVAVLALDGIVPSGFGTGYGAAITSDAFHGEAGDQVRFVYELHAGSDQAKGTGYIRDANTHAIVQTIFDYLVPIVGSTGVQTVNLTLASSGDYTLDFRVGSYDATGGTVIGATLELGFAGILRSGLVEDTPFTFAGTTFLSGVTDADGDTTTLSSVSATSANGASVVLSGGNVTYNPAGVFDYLAANQELIDTFQFTVSDGRGGFDTATANIKVVGVNDAPVVTSAATASFAENGTGIAYTATATDVDSAVLSYSLGGTDAALFNINATTGAVTFKAAPNFEVPTDAGGNNVYDITVSASDGINTSAAKAVAISVTDVAENRAPTLAMGGDGKAIIPVGAWDDVGATMALQSDGKILVAGYSYRAYDVDAGEGIDADYGVIRLNSNGSLDASFDGDGKAIIAVGTVDDFGTTMALQSDGKILVAGYSYNGSITDYSVVRLNANGSLDTSFDGDGKAIIAVGTSDDLGQSMALQSDGKILVAGYSYNGSNYDYSVVRLNANGSLDTSFDGDGKAIIAVGTSYDVGTTMTLQTDGKILVAGYSYNGSIYDYSVVRLNANGSLDTSFDGDGKAIIAVGTSYDFGQSMALQSDGKILVAGHSFNGSNYDYSVVRLNANGSLDTSFDGDGKAIIPVGTSSDQGYSMALQSDGKILVAGSSYNGSRNDYSVIRLNANGSLDTSFDGDGKAIIAVGTFDFGATMTLQSDGKILVAGYSYNGSNYDYSVIRLNANGSLDTSFGVALAASYVENAAPVVLNAQAAVLDADLAASGSYGGASLTLARAGGADAQDVFAGSGTLGALTEGGALTVGTTTIGTVTHNSGGSLTLSFNAGATQALVNEALQHIAYANSSDAPPASVTIDWLFSDGNSGVQGPGGALTASGSTTVLITAVNDAPVVTSGATASFAENGTGIAYTATATDVDSAVLSYSLGGTDAALFNINATTGAVTFKAAPNFEAPTDAGGNNVYDITVSASDGVNTSVAQAVAITVTDVVEAPPSLAGQSVIDLGSYGKLIAPVQVDGGQWFYYWDRSGNGTSANSGTLNGGVDYTTHDVLDGIFNQNISGVVGGGGNTTDTYRYATLNGVHLALPTAGGQSSPPYGAGGINNYAPGTAISGTAANATYNDLLAVWDAYNGTEAGATQVGGTPSGWRANLYWSATPSASGHAYVDLSLGGVIDGTDNSNGYVALQVL